jgi:hypothetical protein
MYYSEMHGEIKMYYSEMHGEIKMYYIVMHGEIKMYYSEMHGVDNSKGITVLKTQSPSTIHSFLLLYCATCFGLFSGHSQTQCIAIIPHCLCELAFAVFRSLYSVVGLTLYKDLITVNALCLMMTGK